MDPHVDAPSARLGLAKGLDDLAAGLPSD